MRAKGFLRICMVTLTMIAGAIPASAASLTEFNVQKAETWADALAICDVTRFLLSEPNLDASAIIATMPGNSHVPLYKPLFVPPSNFYSEAMRQTYERVKASGQVTNEAYGHARMHYAKLMLDAYRHATASDRAFLADQMKLCYALAVSTGGKPRQ